MREFFLATVAYGGPGPGILESSLYIKLNILESKNKITPFQSGFWKGMQTIEPVVCLEDEVRKAQVDDEIVGGVRHAYDML